MDPSSTRELVQTPKGQPPVGKTGVQRTTGLDWITATVKGRSREEVSELVTAYFGPPADRPGGTRFYRSSAQVGEHSILAWDGIADAAGTVMLSLAGSELRGLSGDDQLLLLAALDMGEWRVSRLDAFVDDWDRVVRPEEVRQALIDGNAVTRTKGRGELHSDRWDWQTVYIGSRASGAFLRAYEKGGPQAGAGGRAPQGPPARVRWELELKGESARAYVSELLGGARSQADLFWATVRGLVDFRERQGRAHGERAPMLGWWAELVGAADRAMRSAAESVKGLDQRAAWLISQTARTFATVWLAKGDRWVSDLLSYGMDRLDRRDRWQLAAVGVRS